MKVKKFIPVILAYISIVFICVSFASCGNEADVSGGGGNNDPEGGTQSGRTAEEAALGDIPEENYNGHEFKILISINSLAAVWNDFHAENETGDVINDAIYKRNRYVEDKYNIKISDTEAPPTEDEVNRPDTQKAIKNFVQSGDYAYDAFMLTGYAASELALGGFLMDMNNMNPIDLTKPWWDQKANADLMLKNKMFYTTGDISNVTNQATFAIMFNKKMLSDYGLESPYDFVKSGEWTYSKLNEMCVDVSADLNGDGKYNFDDRYGALIWGDTMLAAVNSIGEKCVQVNNNGELELALNNERVLSAFNNFTELAFDKIRSFQYQNNGDWSDVKSTAMFENGQALFYLKTMQMSLLLRAMETDFGILPYPKLDKSQQNYYSTVSSWDSGFICVPAVQEDEYRTAAILEALAAESANTVKPAYYDLSLKGKYARDEESEEMLDLIFSSKTYDLGWFYRVGMYYAQMMYLNYNYDTNFASMYEKNYDAAVSDLNKINETFAGILN